MAALHPFADLTADEIVAAAQLVRSHHEPGTQLRFKGIALLEPAKKDMQRFRATGQAPARRAWANYYLVGTPRFFECILNVAAGTTEHHAEVAAGFHGPCDDAEILEVERLTLADAAVRAEVAKLALPPGTEVVCEPWIWGADGVAEHRQYQCFLYMRDPRNSGQADGNHYAYPLGFSPVFDTVAMRVTRIDRLPTGADAATRATEPVRRADVAAPSEYVPEEVGALRTDLRDLRVVQPDGASFALDADGVLRWQKWAMRLSFNFREGVVLREVAYDGRPLFYRVALSDMTVPYADPRAPFNKKQAFDLGDTGAGLMANDLALGCDCLGAVAYVDGLIADEEGRPRTKAHAVCVHEQDAGLLWKHTNYRTGRAAVVRRRELVVQSILTVSNYEYILAFVFDQAGQMEYEVRATGILSTQPVDRGVTVPWGTVVHDGVLAVCHQHILSLRVDPELDGDARNRLVCEETRPLPPDPAANPLGNGYVAQRRVLGETGGYDLDARLNRTYLIENPRRPNPVNGAPVAYKIHLPPMQPLLAHPDSLGYKRADFADHSVYVTRYRDGELFAGGQYTNQNERTTGVRQWAARRDDISDEDIVVWVQFGLQHVPRVEDFPVMPVEMVKVGFRPVNFFTKNPALDVPPSLQSRNQSTLVGRTDTGCCGIPARQEE